MKIIIILLIMMSNLAIAEQFEFNRMESIDGFELKFKLYHDVDHENTATLDCQSFLHKFDFYNEQGIRQSENQIDMFQCEEIYTNVMNCFDKNQNKCVDSEDILNSNCVCD